MLHFARSSRWRRAFVAACLPYLLLSVFVDFLHVHPAWGQNSVRGPVATPLVALKAPLQRSPRLPDYSCAVCQWHRIDTRLHPVVAVGQAAGMLPGLVAPLQTAVPESPVPHPPAFRGPPRPFFG